MRAQAQELLTPLPRSCRRCGLGSQIQDSPSKGVDDEHIDHRPGRARHAGGLVFRQRPRGPALGADPGRGDGRRGLCHRPAHTEHRCGGRGEQPRPLPVQ